MKLCKRGLHDLDDPEMVYVNPASGHRQCQPCRLEGMRLAGRRRRALDPEGERKRARENTRRWRAQNPDRARANERAWYAENREEILERKRRWREANPEASPGYSRKWRAQNLEHESQRRRDYYAENSEWMKERNREWVARNRDKRRESSQRYRARVRVANVAEVRDWLAIIASDPCQYCGALGETDDHVVPLSGGGDHCWSNIGRACVACNSSKRDRPFLLWLAGRRSS